MGFEPPHPNPLPVGEREPTEYADVRGFLPRTHHTQCAMAESGLPDASFTSSPQVFLTLSTTFFGIGM
jgi:hypothetical protein